MLLWLFFFTPDVFLLCAATCLVVLFAGLPLMLRPPTRCVGPRAAAAGESDSQWMDNATAMHLAAQASGNAVAGSPAFSNCLTEPSLRRGQRVSGPSAAVVARRTAAVVTFCLVGAGLLGLSVLLFILSAVWPAA